ncbi:MAG: pilus assembly protein TadG-related protein, partial [Pseudomonadota bacterium]
MTVDSAPSCGASRQTTRLGRFLNSTAQRALRFARGEDGSTTLLSLFIFLMILFICGMGVDLMRFETKRAALQNTIDAATLSATSIRSEADAEQLVRDFMAKRGYDPNLVSVGVDEVFTGTNSATGDRGTLVARTVTADYDLDMDTYFMSLLGFETLGTTTQGGAQEGLTTVEISLVLDISGSMRGQKIADLKTSAKTFAEAMIDPARTDLPVAISVVPFNHTVVVPDEILNRLPNSSGDVAIPAAAQAPYPGALTSYPRVAANSKCVRFEDDLFLTDSLQDDLEPPIQNPNYLALRSIQRTQELDRMAYYDPYDKSSGAGDAYARPADEWNRRCDPTRSEILPYETNLETLKTYIEGLRAGGWTSNDTGLKWGVALLDPAFRTLVSDMVADDVLPDAVDGRPYDYDPSQFMKVIVLMTDGANTVQFDVDEPFKNGPSRIWYSEQAANDTGPNKEDWSKLYIVDTDGDGTADRPKGDLDGYFVEMPNNSASTRWLRPHNPGNFDDGVAYAETALPPDAVQRDYTELYDRFSTNAVANLFQDSNFGDNDAFLAHSRAEIITDNNPSANRRMSGQPETSRNEFGLCDAAKANNDILMFTIAFRAGSDAERVMRDCATSDGFYFNAQNGEQLNQA